MKYSILTVAIAFFAFATVACSQAVGDDTAQAKTKRFTASDNAFSIDLAAASPSELVPREKVIRPNITSVMHLDGDPDFKAAVVYTKIRADYPQGDKVIDLQKPRFEQMQRSIGDAFVMTDTTSHGKRSLTYTFDGETYDKTIFPFGVTRGPVADGKFSIGGHRFMVRNGYLFEVACVLMSTEPDADNRRTEVLARLIKLADSLDFTPAGE